MRGSGSPGGMGFISASRATIQNGGKKPARPTSLETIFSGGAGSSLPLGYRTPLKYFSYFKEEPPYGIKNEAIRQRIHKYYAKAKLDDIENIEQYGYPYFPVAQLIQLRRLVKHVIRKLPEIRLPVQLIQAKDDDMTSVKNSKFIYDRISSSIKEIVLLYDSYHVVTADQERDLVAAKMENFFSKFTPESINAQK